MRCTPVTPDAPAWRPKQPLPSIQLEVYKLLAQRAPADAEDRLRELISKGARLDDVVSPSGYSAIHYVATTNRVDWVGPLVACGADLDAREGGGPTPLERACIGVSKEMQLALLAAGARPTPAALIETTFLHVVQAMLAAGADVNWRDARGRTPLFTHWVETKTTALLLDHGADINATMEDGSRAVDVIIDQANALMIDADESFAFFLARGADLVSPSRDGRRPLDRAMEKSSLRALAHAYATRLAAREVLQSLGEDEPSGSVGASLGVHP